VKMNLNYLLSVLSRCALKLGVCGCVWVWVCGCGCVWVRVGACGCVCKIVRSWGETHLNCLLSAFSRCVCVCEQVCLCVLGVWVWVKTWMCVGVCICVGEDGLELLAERVEQVCVGCVGVGEDVDVCWCVYLCGRRWT